MREAWTDERLDDLKEGMHREFDQVHREFGRIDKRFEQIDKRFEQVDKRFDGIHSDLRALNGRVDSLNRTMIFGWVSIMATLLGAVLGKGLV